MKSQKGFNLIELLVVIAIIGVLSTIALASLNSARVKSADAAVKSELKALSAQAEVYYDTNGRYNQNSVTPLTYLNCQFNSPWGMFGNPVIARMIKNIDKNMSTANSEVIHCYTDDIGQTWSIGVTALRGGGSWCVDNKGFNAAGTAGADGCS